ncbi:hypothetical protein [Nonomuraea sp. NPDC003201]
MALLARPPRERDPRWHLLPAPALAAAVTLASPPAHADTFRTASSSGWGPSWSAGQANARAELNRRAAQAGEVCPSVSVTSTHVYTAPGGAWYIYDVTVSANCTG